MITIPIAELKAQFCKVLDAVRAGERVGVLYGKSREPVAMIVPFEPFEPVDLPERDVGFLDGKVRIAFMATSTRAKRSCSARRDDSSARLRASLVSHDTRLAR